MKLRILVFMFVSLSTLTFSQELWNKVEFGMTSMQIKEIHQNCTEPEIIRKGPTGAYTGLKIDGYSILGSLYNISFIFSSEDKLDTVSIIPNEKNLDVNSGNGRFQELNGILKTIYGSETYHVKYGSSGTMTEYACWITQEKNVLLRLDSVSSVNMTVLFIQYSKSKIKELEKL